LKLFFCSLNFVPRKAWERGGFYVSSFSISVYAAVFPEKFDSSSSTVTCFTGGNCSKPEIPILNRNSNFKYKYLGQTYGQLYRKSDREMFTHQQAKLKCEKSRASSLGTWVPEHTPPEFMLRFVKTKQ
jgi:hypothetical protein